MRQRFYFLTNVGMLLVSSVAAATLNILLVLLVAWTALGSAMAWDREAWR